MNALFSQLIPQHLIPQGLFIIPPVLTSDPVHEREEVQTPPPRREANRWYTTVCVELEDNGHIRRIKWFSDLQMAWIYVQRCVLRNTRQVWNFKSFDRTARCMDIRWNEGRGDLGFVIAKSNRYKFRAFYEPDEEGPPRPTQ